MTRSKACLVRDSDPAGLDTCYILILYMHLGGPGPRVALGARTLNKSIVYCRFSSQVDVVCVRALGKLPTLR